MMNRFLQKLFGDAEGEKQVGEREREMIYSQASPTLNGSHKGPRLSVLPKFTCNPSDNEYGTDRFGRNMLHVRKLGMNHTRLRVSAACIPEDHVKVPHTADQVLFRFLPASGLSTSLSIKVPRLIISIFSVDLQDESSEPAEHVTVVH